MTTKITIKLIASFISIIVMTLLLTADDSFARRRDRVYSSPRNTHRERVVVRNHVRHEPEWTARKKFLYKRGGYYRPYRSRYYPAKNKSYTQTSIRLQDGMAGRRFVLLFQRHILR